MAKRSVRRPYERVQMNVACQSSRGGVRPRLIVLHSTEGHNRKGISDLRGLGHYFDDPNTEASSHVAVDNEGYSAKFVPDDRKSWTQAYYNAVSLSVEMIGFAAQSKWRWLANDRAQLKKVAKYIAYWSRKYGIPVRQGRVSAGGSILRTGVVSHKSLGTLGGGHVDPGNFPIGACLVAARYYRRYGWK